MLEILEPGIVRIHVLDSIEHPFSNLFRWISRFSGKVAGNPVGLTLGHTILIDKCYANDQKLIAHELVHVRQYEQLGGHVSFLMQYIYECLWYGYKNSPLEQEADSLAQSVIDQLEQES